MSSVVFSGVSNTNTHPPHHAPILLDQIAIYNPIYTSAKEDAWKANPHAERKGPELIKHPLTSFVADPRVYSHSKGKNVLHPFGRFVSLSNGRRIFKALQGNPLSHAISPKWAPKQKTIEDHEYEINQFDPKELRELIELATIAGKLPHQLQLDSYMDSLTELWEFVVSEKGLQRHNDLVYFKLSEANLERLELYLEIPCANKTDEVLRKTFEKTLRRYFGSPSTDLSSIEEDNAEDRIPNILKWRIPSHYLSNQLVKQKGKHRHAIKFYRKGPMVRLEIQLNSPSLKKSEHDRTEDFLDSCFFKNDVYKMADIAAACLRDIEQLAHRELAKAPSQKDWEIRFAKMKERCRVLLSRSYDKEALLKVLTIIAQKNYIPLKTALKLGVARPAIQRLCDSKLGFLNKEPNGLPTQSATQSKRQNGINCVLVPEWLDRTEIPKPRLAAKTADYAKGSHNAMAMLCRRPRQTQASAEITEPGLAFASASEINKNSIFFGNRSSV